MNIKKKSLTKFLTFAALIFSAVYIALSAVYSLTASNVVYASSFIPVVIELLIPLCDLAAYAVCFSVFVYSIYRKGVKKSLPVIFIYCGILLAEKFIDTTAGHLIFGTGWELEGLIYVLIMWLLEVLFAFSVVLIGYLCTKGKKLENMSFDKFYSKKNALQTSALFVSIIVSLTKIIPRVIYDIGYGAPADIIDLLWMVALYSSDIISGAIVYTVSIFVMKKLCASENL